jgi:2'-5' RNA ligase
MRAFLAIDLGSAARERYAAIHDEARRRFRHLRWVPPENLHITLRFLGEVAPEGLAAIESGVRASVSPLPPFRAVLGRPGGFGSPSAPKVLWLSLARGAEEASALAAAIEAVARGLGFAPERGSWRAHATLARNPEGRDCAGWEDLVASAGLEGMEVPVRDVVLYESVLLPRGSRYSVVWNLPLEHETPSQA